MHDSEGDLSDDEKALEQQNEFEHKYNFRFEEPDGVELKSIIYFTLIKLEIKNI